jgi:hypothetical protein
MVIAASCGSSGIEVLMTTPSMKCSESANAYKAPRGIEHLETGLTSKPLAFKRESSLQLFQSVPKSSLSVSMRSSSPWLSALLPLVLNPVKLLPP